MTHNLRQESMLIINKSNLSKQLIFGSGNSKALCAIKYGKKMEREKKKVKSF